MMKGARHRGIEARRHDGTKGLKETVMEETLFQKIIARKIPAKIVYEDEKYIVINDIQPQAPVHLLAIPKKLIPTLNDLTPGDAELVGGLFLVARQVMAQM